MALRSLNLMPLERSVRLTFQVFPALRKAPLLSSSSSPALISSTRLSVFGPNSKAARWLLPAGGSFPVGSVRHFGGSISGEEGSFRNAPLVAACIALPGDWQSVYSQEHGRHYYWHTPSGATQWEPPELATDALPRAAPNATTTTTAAAAAADAIDSSVAVAATKSTATSASSATATASGAEASMATADSVALQSSAAAPALPEGWLAVSDAASGREYFWHQPSGRTSWERPETPPPHSLQSSSSNVPFAATQAAASPTVAGTPANLERRTESFQKPSATVSSAVTVPTSDASGDASAVGRLPVPVTNVPVSVSVSSEWQAVFSEAHGRHYYWHQPSGSTTWEKPEALRTSEQVAAGSVEDPLFVAWRDPWRQVLHEAILGKGLRGEELRLVQELLSHHPDAARKIGVGLRGIKVDASPPPHGRQSRCFWVLRADGSEEDFSARKCTKAIRTRSTD
ncbi:unnamed protein product [Polarella glacialis]|uniref:WW domain-containing protein n=1 Tax=Polarella glacialis TaxID=89957 RepID=A0A813GD73_POLGL|nr:unnamed protein product [Polarella glacialis]